MNLMLGHVQEIPKHENVALSAIQYVGVY